MQPLVKICGLTRHVDAEVAAAAGASFLGVVLAPGGVRSVTTEQAQAVFGELGLRRVGVFVNADPAELCRTAETLRLDVVQLHGDEDAEFVRKIRGAGPWSVWKAIRLRDADELPAAVAHFDGAADGILLDGWHPDARGGTGTEFPWDAVAGHRVSVPTHLSLIVAGGLRPANVGQAAVLLRPTVLDVSSGVEHSPGIKDAEAIRAFVAAATQTNI